MLLTYHFLLESWFLGKNGWFLVGTNLLEGPIFHGTMIMGGRVPFDDAKTSFEKTSIPETLRYKAGKVGPE